MWLLPRFDLIIIVQRRHHCDYFIYHMLIPQGKVGKCELTSRILIVWLNSFYLRGKWIYGEKIQNLKPQK